MSGCTRDWQVPVCIVDIFRTKYSICHGTKWDLVELAIVKTHSRFCLCYARDHNWQFYWYNLQSYASVRSSRHPPPYLPSSFNYPLSHSLTHSPHSLIHPRSHQVTHSPTHLPETSTHSFTHSPSHQIYSLTRSFTHSLTYSLIHSSTHFLTSSLIHSLTHSLTL